MTSVICSLENSFEFNLQPTLTFKTLKKACQREQNRKKQRNPFTGVC